MKERSDVMSCIEGHVLPDTFEPLFFEELREKLRELELSFEGRDRETHKLFKSYIFSEKTLSEIADDERLSVERIRQRLLRHGRVLRHPKRVDLIRDFWSGKNESFL